MPTYRLLVEYEGTRYRGWQVQPNARTVQGELIEAARYALRDGRAMVQGAGRTDAGVHALGQVAHLVTSSSSRGSLVHALNDLLPHDICVRTAERCADSFHSRHDALLRSYVYLIARRRSAFGKRFCWWVKDDLDAEAMHAASRVLVGSHDFRSFADTSADPTGSARVEMRSVELLARRDLILLRFAASHFLWKMVRRLTGTLVEVGRGRVSVNDLVHWREVPSSEPAQWTAPPSGLFLESVLYPGDTLLPLELPRFPFLLPDGEA